MSFFAAQSPYPFFNLGNSTLIPAPPTSGLPTRRQSLNRRISPYPSPSPSPPLVAEMSVPTQRQPHASSSTSLRPSGSAKVARPRPGLGRTTSFSPSVPGQGYASASQASNSSPPGRLSKPLVRSENGHVMAPTMQRSLSSLGIDGYRLNRESGPGHNRSRPTTPSASGKATVTDSEVSSPSVPAVSVPVPTIIIDSPERTSSYAPVFEPPTPFHLPLQSTPTPGFEGYSPSFSEYSTPGPATPYDRLGETENERREERTISSGKDIEVEEVSRGVEDMIMTRRGSAVTV